MNVLLNTFEVILNTTKKQIFRPLPIPSKNSFDPESSFLSQEEKMKNMRDLISEMKFTLQRFEEKALSKENTLDHERFSRLYKEIDSQVNSINRIWQKYSQISGKLPPSQELLPPVEKPKGFPRRKQTLNEEQMNKLISESQSQSHISYLNDVYKLNLAKIEVQKELFKV